MSVTATPSTKAVVPISITVRPPSLRKVSTAAAPNPVSVATMMAPMREL